MRRPSVGHSCASGLELFTDLVKPGFSVDLGDKDSNKFEWSKVNITAGTKVMISVLDDKDDEGWSSVVSRENVFPIDFLTHFLLFSRLLLSRVMTAPV